MKTIAILILLSVFVFQSVSVGAQEASDTLEAHEIVGAVGTWGAIAVGIVGFIPVWAGGPQHPSQDQDPLTLPFAVSMGLTGVAGGLLGLVGYDTWGLAATITGGVVLGIGLTAPALVYGVVYSVLHGVLIPISFILDTILLYGPLTDYRASLGNLFVDANIGDIATGYYAAPETWISLIPPTIWLLGLGIVSLVLEDSNSSIARTLNNENVSIIPVVAPGKMGLIASLRFP